LDVRDSRSVGYWRHWADGAPFVVNGLLRRGFDVTILHGGHHEIEFEGVVRHLHGDLPFRESLEALLGNRSFDVVGAMYGRLPVTTDVFRRRANQIVAVGAGMGAAAPFR
jgi:hypothetical protein